MPPPFLDEKLLATVQRSSNRVAAPLSAKFWSAAPLNARLFMSVHSMSVSDPLALRTAPPPPGVLFPMKSHRKSLMVLPRLTSPEPPVLEPSLKMSPLMVAMFPVMKSKMRVVPPPERVMPPGRSEASISMVLSSNSIADVRVIVFPERLGSKVISVPGEASITA